MQKRLVLLLFVALVGLTSQALAQALNGGSSQDCSDPTQQGSSACLGSQQQNNSADCSSPMMQGSAQCPQGSSGSRSSGMQSGSQSQSPLQQMTNQIYQDSNLAAPQPRSTDLLVSSRLPPAPLTQFQKFVAATTGQVLPIYGASLFRNLPSTFAPLDQTPVPPNYGIGPGDELRIRIWGHTNLTADQRVDRSGDIYLPQIGPIHVGGLPYADLQKHLKESVGRIYRNFELTVDLGQIRAIQVYVTGQAQRPGLYTVSSLSTLANLLFSSGGPSPQGSMRHAELKRDGKTLVDFDLYDLLLRGDKSKDVPLLNGDILFIPAIGANAAMTGSVGNPAIYELRAGETIGELLKDAGGYSETAAAARISIDRIEGHDHRMAMEIPNDAASLATPLNDGDVLRILSIVPSFAKTVTLRGNLGSPGRFAWHQGMHLSDLIPDRNALVTRDYWWKRTQLGLPAPEFEPLEQFYNLRQPSTQIDLPLTADQKQQYRRLHAPENADPLVDIGVAPDAPVRMMPSGDSSGKNKDGTVSATGMMQSGQSPFTSQQDQQDSSRDGKSGHCDDPSLCPELAQATRRPVVLQPKNDVRLEVAEINWDDAVIERTNPETFKSSLLHFDLGRLVQQHDSSQDLELQPGDVVTIFSQADIHVPQAQQTKFVHIEGEVVHAGIYSVKPGQTLRDLVREAGGFTPDAYLFGSVFTRVSNQIEQQKRLDEYVHNIEMQVQSLNTNVPASSGGSDKDLASAGMAQKMEIDLVSHLRQVRASGRVVLNFKDESANIESIPAMTLENGDSFVVPAKPSTISVVGAVYNQGAFLYEPSRRAKNYLRSAGGASRTADVSRTFVIRADGSVIGSAQKSSPWGSSFKEVFMNPGDAIVVPNKVYDPTAMRTFLDVVTMLSQLAVGAGTIGYLLTR
jgi:protein involved in polysaccharide export with SLBB domain